MSQRFYEEKIGTPCEDVTSGEIEHLKCVQTGSGQNFSDLDSIAEHLVFKPIADCEASTNECLLTETRRLRDNSEAQTLAIQATCENLPVLKDAVNNIAQLQGWITTYTRVNDRRVRAVPESEFQKNLLILAELKQRAGFRSLTDPVSPH